jgi:hypothetical protein
MKKFSAEEAKTIGDKIGVDWTSIPLTQFQMGLAVEMEHGKHDPQTNVTNNDPIATGKITLAHLKEDPFYYTKLKKVEGEKEKNECVLFTTSDLVLGGRNLLKN